MSAASNTSAWQRARAWDNKSLAFGEAADASMTRWFARRLFLWAVEELAPHALAALHRDVLPRYAEPAEWARRLESGEAPAAVHAAIVAAYPLDPTNPRDVRPLPEAGTLRAWEELDALATHGGPHLRPLRDALVTWAAATFHVPGAALRADPWLLDVGLWTLVVWVQSPPEPSRLGWGPFAHGYDLPLATADRVLVLPEHLRSWDPTHEPAEVFVARAKAAVTAHAARVMPRLKGLGWPQASRKRKFDHFEWFVAYQIHGRSFGEISRDEVPLAAHRQGKAKLRGGALADRKAGMQVVSDGVHDIAKRIELPLRPAGRAGAPRKRG